MSYQLAICEMFHPVLHGQDENSSPQINNHFLIYTIIDLSDFYNNAYLFEENSLKRYMKAIQLLHSSLDETHPTIRNYSAVTNKYIRLEIIQTDVLEGQEEVAYLKTYWIRLIQRRWKKVYKARKEILIQERKIKTIQERQRTGKNSIHFSKWPVFNLH